ncbi:MAG: hypothetical protein ACLTPC_03395 [Lacrimispora saccharolytica]
MVPTTEEIVDVIQQYPNIMDTIELRIRNMNEEYLCLNQTIYRYAAYKCAVYGKVGYDGTNSDLSDVLKKKNHQEQEYREELKKTIIDLTQKADNVRRLHLCYMVLPYKYHELLRMLYQEKITWGKLSEMLAVSISTLSRRRERAFTMIRIAYGSSLSYTEILHLQKLQKGIMWDQLMREFDKGKQESHR